VRHEGVEREDDRRDGVEGSLGAQALPRPSMVDSPGYG
jgi:hypothetical protein